MLKSLFPNTIPGYKIYYILHPLQNIWGYNSKYTKCPRSSATFFNIDLASSNINQFSKP